MDNGSFFVQCYLDAAQCFRSDSAVIPQRFRSATKHAAKPQGQPSCKYLFFHVLCDMCLYVTICYHIFVLKNVC